MLVFALLAFAAGLVLDTAAVLHLVFGWAARLYGRAPIETILAALALIAVAWLVFARRAGEAPRTRGRRAPAKPRKAARTARGKPGGSSDQPDNDGPPADPAKAKASRRKNTKIDA